MMMIYFVTKGYDVNKVMSLKKSIYVFVSGLTFTIVNMTIIGIYQLVSEGHTVVSRHAMDGFSGLGHIVLTIGIVSMAYKIFQNETEKQV